jgi:hypothetical protein
MDLPEFLVRAKKATYAGGATATVLEDGCKQLTYREGGYEYRDRYYGNDPFAGQEVVFQNGEIIWSMVYRGETINLENPEPIYAFLRKAMLQVSEERPFRGPSELRGGGLAYTDKSEGTPSAFSGIERISQDGRAVYVLRYSGGFVR